MKMIRWMAGASAACLLASSLVGAAEFDAPASLETSIRRSAAEASASEGGVSGPVQLTVSRKDRKSGDLLVYQTVALSVGKRGVEMGYRFFLLSRDGSGVTLAAMARGKTFTERELQAIPRMFRKFMSDPELIRMSYDPKGLHQAMYLPLRSRLRRDGVETYAYAVGGEIGDVLFTAVAEAGVGILNAGTQVVLLVKNTFERVKTGVGNYPLRRAAKNSRDLMSSKTLSHRQFEGVLVVIEFYDWIKD